LHFRFAYRDGEHWFEIISNDMFTGPDGFHELEYL